MRQTINQKSKFLNTAYDEYGSGSEDEEDENFGNSSASKNLRTYKRKTDRLMSDTKKQRKIRKTVLIDEDNDASQLQLSKSYRDEFFFQERTQKLDWKMISQIDLTKLEENTDIDLLETIADNLVFANVTKHGFFFRIFYYSLDQHQNLYFCFQKTLNTSMKRDIFIFSN